MLTILFFNIWQNLIWLTNHQYFSHLFGVIQRVQIPFRNSFINDFFNILWKRRVWFILLKLLWQCILLECECSPPDTSYEIKDLSIRLPLGLADSRCMGHARPFSFSVNHSLTGCFYSQVSINPLVYPKLCLIQSVCNTPLCYLILQIQYFKKPNTPK